MSPIIEEIQQGVKKGNAQLVKDKTELALHQGLFCEQIIEEGLIEPMNAIGDKFKGGNIFIPEVLMSSRAMHAGLYILKPVLRKDYKAAKGTILIGTVAGDLHDIGKNMIAMMLESQGYAVVDLGIDVPAAAFVQAIEKYNPDILALSALLTTTMGEQGEVIEEIQRSDLSQKTRIIVGGGPVTEEFAKAIGADGYGKDLFEAMDLVDHMMG